MKKDDRFKKIIFQRLAKKSFRRKLRSKVKQKNRNKQLLRLNKQHRKERNNKRLDNKRFIDFKQIKAPVIFSLTKNTEETLNFINQIKDCFERRKKVFVDLKKVETISHGAIVVLLSILVKFRTNNIEFNGNFPASNQARNNLKKSGFFKNLGNKLFEKQDEYSFENEIRTHAEKKVNSELSDAIIKRASAHIWDEERRCIGLQRVFLELMQNTNNHASFEKLGEQLWWLSIYYSDDKSKVCFAFIDYGVGIFESIVNKREHEKFFGIIPKIKEKFGFNTNAELLKLLLFGEVHNIANYYRGKGLPGIYKACQENRISNLVIISNNAIADYANNKFENLNNNLKGTFVYWELNASNVNIK